MIDVKFLHVGFHRTGSTFLQTKVFPSLQNFNVATDLTLGNDIIAFNELVLQPPGFFDANRNYQSLKKIFSTNNYKAVSLESLTGYNSGYHNGTQIHFICERLAQTFRPEKIIIFVRSHYSHIWSNYKGDVRMGSVLPFSHWIKQKAKSFELNFALQGNIVNLYKKMFGEIVEVVPFEVLYQPSGLNYDILEKLFAKCGFRESSIKGNLDVKINEFPDQAVAFQLICNRLFSTKLNTATFVGRNKNLWGYNFAREKLIPNISKIMPKMRGKMVEFEFFLSICEDLQIQKDLEILSENCCYDLKSLGYPHR